MEDSAETKRSQPELKHLGFVRAAAINTFLCLSSLYDSAKPTSGSLKSAVGSVEGLLATFFTPVYDKCKDVPDHLLAFLDDKVDVAEKKFNECAPPLAKQLASQMHCLMEAAAQKAKQLLQQAQEGGLLAAAHYAAKESKDLLLDQSVKVWCKLDELPPFHVVAELTVPTATHLTEKYNKIISDLREKGHTAFSYVPMIPTDEIAKAVKQYKGTNELNDGSQSAEEAASE